MNSQGDNDAAKGTLQIYQNGTWGSVCDRNSFNDAAAKIICTKLSYPVVRNVFRNSFYGPVTGKILYCKFV